MFCSMITDIKEWCERFGFLIIPMVAVYCSYMHCEAVEFKANFSPQNEQ